ncbi:hypothetical protein PC9H_002322 [Pleurotus ostreatus]|uniref:Uncharacterized protein n=1 Tax=Pleurotus ostreatus TaxID=5322 RepID=A0A8H6ZNA0_PLEOS|nr:uncharacterized protein PC9H_002322 [Pleurotus ostreatus]KAF7416062.1 hypothetical protein PC9H_002322 [Pleurotus ostreatus]
MASQPPPHPHNIQGDFYAASQMGGNAGGHGNHNNIFNGGQEDMKTQLATIRAMYEAQNMSKYDYNTYLGQVQKIQETLGEMLRDADDLEGKLEADRQKKFPPRNRMPEVDANWPTPAATKSMKRGK